MGCMRLSTAAGCHSVPCPDQVDAHRQTGQESAWAHSTHGQQLKSVTCSCSNCRCQLPLHDACRKVGTIFCLDCSVCSPCITAPGVVSCSGIWIPGNRNACTALLLTQCSAQGPLSNGLPCQLLTVKDSIHLTCSGTAWILRPYSMSTWSMPTMDNTSMCFQDRPSHELAVLHQIVCLMQHCC